MKKYILLFATLFLLGCINTQKKADENSQGVCKCLEDSTSENPQEVHDKLIDSLFLVKSLRDTLYAYMNYIDTIPNPWGSPIMYFMEFHKVKSDTIVMYLSCAGLMEVVGAEPLLRGAVRLRKRDFVIYSLGFRTLNNIINEKLLSADYLDFLRDSVYIPSDIDYSVTYAAPIWEYKYSNENLILIEKDDRDLDKIKEKLKKKN